MKLNCALGLHQAAVNAGFYSSSFAADNTKARGDWEGLSNFPEDKP